MDEPEEEVWCLAIHAEPDASRPEEMSGEE
jgi:hypothetical protein